MRFVAEIIPIDSIGTIEHAPPSLLAHQPGRTGGVAGGRRPYRLAVVAQNREASLLVKVSLAGTPTQSPYPAVINKQGPNDGQAASELGFSVRPKGRCRRSDAAGRRNSVPWLRPVRVPMMQIPIMRMAESHRRVSVNLDMRLPVAFPSPCACRWCSSCSWTRL
jgi:hypothetical protein